MANWKHRDLQIMLLISLALLLAGCGSDQDIGLVEGYGTITLDGQPLADAEVVFEFPGMYGPTLTRGRTDGQGRYRLKLADTYSGTFKGKQTVRITGAAGVGPIPPRYNQDSELTVEVKAGGAPYDFDLTSDSDEQR